MSIEAHPNLHAAGLTVDILTSLELRIRGPAKRRLSQAEVNALLGEEIVHFVAKVSTLLDHAVEMKERG